MHNSLRNALSFLVLLFGLIAVSTASAQNPKKDAGLSVPVVGTGANGASFDGNFTVQRFAQAGDGVVAIGVLTGVVKSGTATVGSIVKNVAMPVTLPNQSARGITIQQAASCEILHLDIGPISLDLLGLQIDLSRIVLDITAVPGAGNLLGNLLCAIAGLLDRTGPLNQIVNLLNQILAILQNL